MKIITHSGVSCVPPTAKIAYTTPTDTIRMRNPPSISVTHCMRAPRRFDVSADLDFLMTAHTRPP
jgi:hypothetical protein